MHISAKTILEKMEQQLQLAKEHEHDRDAFRLHIANVKMLTELLLEDGEQQSKKNADIASAVIEANEQERKIKQQQLQAMDESPYEDDGTSIFDF